MASVPDGPDLRIVIIEKTWMGKSAAGDTILGEKRFNSKLSFGSLRTCEKAVTHWGKRQISVVDTPGLWATYHSDEIVKREMVRSLKLSCPGPHVFLLVLRLGRFTEEDKHSVEYLQELFGPEVSQYMMVLFTGGDLLEDTTMKDYLYEYQDLHKIILKCGNRFHVFNNRMKDRCQVGDLIKKIDNMVAENGGTYYTGNETVAVRGLQDVVSAIENLYRAASNVSCITSSQLTVDVNINLVLRDTNSSQIVWEGDRAVCLPSAGLQRLCLQDSSDQILVDARSSFIEGISGPVLKSLLDKLFEKKVLTDSERESADEMLNRGDKARFVIDTVRRKGEAASSEMIEFLQEVDPFLCKHIGLI